MQKLPTNFIHEVLRLCIHSKRVCEICSEHFRYEYIPDELPELKRILKTTATFFKANEMPPSFGIISKMLSDDLKTLEQIELIKSLDLTKINEVLLMKELEDYIKKAKFNIMNSQIYDLYTSNKQDEAIKLSAEVSPEIANFTLKKNTTQFIDIIGNYDKFIVDRLELIEENNSKTEDKRVSKIKFGIDEIDQMTRGGMSRKDTALFIAPSGYGKSTFAKWVGFYNCVFNNSNVLHLQLEGGKDEVIEKYYQLFFNIQSEVLESLSYSDKKKKQVEKLFKALGDKLKDITVYSAEMFDDMSIKDAYNLIREYNKVKGYYPDLVIGDSLDLFEVGDGKKYPASYEGIKLRKNNVAKKMKNIATEFDLAFITVDQVSGLPPEKLNDPDFTITRYHTEGDRTLIKPFSFVLSHNQTIDEYNNEKARIYIDKFRNFKIKKQIVDIYTKYDFGKYYDAVRTQKKILNA